MSFLILNSALRIPHSAFHVSRVREKREEEEEAAQHVLALGNPGHRLDAQRVEGEEGGDDGAGPQRAGHPSQEQEQQQRVERVEDDIDQVHRAGVHPKELAIEDVGQGGHRMPVADDARGESIANARPGQAGCDLGFIRHVFRVVVAEKAVVPHGPIDGQHEGRQGHTDARYPTHWRLLSWKYRQSANRIFNHRWTQIRISGNPRIALMDDEFNGRSRWNHEGQPQMDTDEHRFEELVCSLRGFNAEAQRFAEVRREFFFSAFLRASAFKIGLARVTLRGTGVCQGKVGF